MIVPSDHGSIQVVNVRIRNFRSIRSIDVILDNLTLLIGQNNSGKTSFIDALFSAIGSGRRSISEEDVYLSPLERKAPKDRKVIIDICIRPSDGRGIILSAFEEDSYWMSLWGRAICIDNEDNHFVAIRTESKWDSVKGEFTTERKFLGEWLNNDQNIEQARINNSIYVSYEHLQSIAMYFMDAKRDIHDELQNKGSFWYKLVSDPGLDDHQIVEIEQGLNDINQSIIDNSAVLLHIQEHLNDLYQAISCERNSVDVTPVSRTIRNLSKGIGVTFATKDSQSFPLDRHGMGTRSLAALLTFRAYTTWHQRNLDDRAIHPILALEEPESHLHPQAQRSLFNLINRIPGQRIVSTHSPYIASQAELTNLRHFRKDGSETIVTELDTQGLKNEDIRKINRLVMNTRGELLYARALVFFEGESEEQVLPIFAEYYWRRNPIELGISFIGVGGAAGYLPFLRLANSFHIPWYIFADGELVPVKRMRNAVRQIGIDNCEVQPNIIILPNGNNYESYLLQENYDLLISNVLDEIDGINYIDRYIQNNQNNKGKNESARDYKGSLGRKNAIRDAMYGMKTQCAVPIARAIVDYADDMGLPSIPPAIEQLLAIITSDLHIDIDVREL